MEPASLRIACASSGLGHVARGVEIWMESVAASLPGDPSPALFQGGPATGIAAGRARRIPGMSRDHHALRWFSWQRRYLIEQLSCLPGLIRHLRGSFDVVYCGDPVLTWKLKKHQGWHRCRVVFMNGMRLSPSWASYFDGVHLLAPPYLEEARTALGEPGSERFFAVPHCVDTDHFRPTTSAEEKAAARLEWNLPEQGKVLLTVGPVGTVSHKRLEHLAREVAAAGPDYSLVSAGVTEPGQAAVIRECREALGDRIIFLGPVAREAMPRLYRAADAYTLGSLAEPFSIAILEALASGLPVLHHHDPVMRWQTGAGGASTDLNQTGLMAACIQQLFAQPGGIENRGREARKLALDRYAPGPVMQDLRRALDRIGRQPPRAPHR